MDINWEQIHVGEIYLRSCGFCNLSEVVIRPTDTLSDLCEKVRVASIIGTFQSTLTNFRYIRNIWKKNAEEERLLGVSLTGIMDHPVLSRVSGEAKEWLVKMKEVAVEVNKEWANKLGIEASVSITCVKPSGTVSELVDASSGIHPRFSEYYVRSVRNDIKDPLATLMVDQHVPYEPDITKPDSILVFSFPKKSPPLSVMRNDITAIEQLNHYRMIRDYWCEHNPSCFTGEERFITKDGIVSFADVVGTKQMVLTSDGYKEAEVKSFGKQKIWEVEILKNQKRRVIRTTGNHIFPVTYPHQRWANYQIKSFETKNLPIGKQFVNVIPKIEFEFNLEGFLHGVVFGDGTSRQSSNGPICSIALCGKKRVLAKYFKGYGNTPIERDDIDQTRIYSIKYDWKSLPDENNKSCSYLQSFVAGWFATDGSITQSVIGISSSVAEYLQWLVDKGPKFGLHLNYWRNSGKKYQGVSFIKSNLTTEFFIREDQRENFSKEVIEKFWNIKSVKETDDYEEVFCIVEPETNHFVLEGNILTHNCTIYIKPDEWLAVGNWIYTNWDDVGGISFLPHSDHVYKQAPFVDINETEYNRLNNSFPIIDYTQISKYESDDNTTSTHELACVSGVCMV